MGVSRLCICTETTRTQDLVLAVATDAAAAAAPVAPAVCTLARNVLGFH